MTRYPLLIMLALLVLVWLTDRLLPTPLHLWWLQWLGLALLLAGVLLLILAAGLFRARGTTVDPTRSPDVLVTDGLYRLSRNPIDRKSTRLNSSHVKISYAVFCLKKKNKKEH